MEKETFQHRQCLELAQTRAANIFGSDQVETLEFLQPGDRREARIGQGYLPLAADELQADEVGTP